MCFDTTAGNTGNKAGIRDLLQQEHNKKLINLAFRQHVHELIVAKVFNLRTESSSGPKIKLFEIFSKPWNDIGVCSYNSEI